MDVVWLNLFKLNRFETGLSASVNGAYVFAGATNLGMLENAEKLTEPR